MQPATEHNKGPWPADLTPLSPEQNLRQALSRFVETRQTVLPVCHEERLIGTLALTDIIAGG